MPPSAGRCTKLFSVRATEGGLDNRPLIARILELRSERARLLGYANFADLVLEDRMAHDGARALAFLDDLKVEDRGPLPRGESRAARIPAVARRPAGGIGAGMWPTTRKSNAPPVRFRRRSSAAILPAGTGGGRLFDLVHRLYGLRIEQEAGAPVWDEAVRYYNVHDEAASSWRLLHRLVPARKQARRRLDDALITGGPEARNSARIWGWSAAT